MDIENTPAPPRKSKLWKNVAIGVAAAAAMAVTVVAVADVTTPTPNPGATNAPGGYPGPWGGGQRNHGRFGPDGPGGPEGHGGHHFGGFGGKLGLGGLLHGEGVVNGTTSGTYRTIDLQRGQVSAVSKDSITLKSADGYTKTYSVTSDTKVMAPPNGISSISNSDQALVIAENTGGTLKALRIVDLTKLPARQSFSRGGGSNAPNQTPATPSSTSF